jgi:hypothetical protein
MMPEVIAESVRDDLIAEIISALDGVSREDGITLHEAMCIDDRESDEECLAARRFDTEQRWQDIPDDFIEGSSSALSFLGHKGFRYYLPAFLLYGLRHFDNDPLKRFENDADDILHSCYFHLLHDHPNSWRKSEPVNIAKKFGFDHAQCCVIAKFLRLMSGNDITRTELVQIQAVEKWEKLVQDQASIK